MKPKQIFAVAASSILIFSCGGEKNNNDAVDKARQIEIADSIALANALAMEKEYAKESKIIFWLANTPKIGRVGTNFPEAEKKKEREFKMDRFSGTLTVPNKKYWEVTMMSRWADDYMPDKKKPDNSCNDYRPNGPMDFHPLAINEDYFSASEFSDAFTFVKVEGGENIFVASIPLNAGSTICIPFDCPVSYFELTIAEYVPANDSVIQVLNNNYPRTIEGKFEAISVFEGAAKIEFIKTDGSKIVFDHNLMSEKNLGFDFVDPQTGSGPNPALKGKLFTIACKVTEQANDASGEMEVVNKIEKISLK